MDAKRQRDLALRLGSAIAHHRELAGLTQEQVSEALGIGNQAVSRMERGAVMPTMPRLFEFATLFGCRIDELILAASDREADQAATIAIQIANVHPRDRELLSGLVKQLAEHFGKRSGERRGRS